MENHAIDKIEPNTKPNTEPNTDPKAISEFLSNLSLDKYENYTKQINNMCIDSAEKGNVYLVLTKTELDSIKFPISEHNLKTLKIFLQEEGLLVVTNYTDPKIEIFWVQLVINKKTGQTGPSQKLGGDISTKFPPISDKDIRKLLISDHAESETNPDSRPKTFIKFEDDGREYTRIDPWYTLNDRLPKEVWRRGGRSLRARENLPTKYKPLDYRISDDDLWNEWGVEDAKQVSKQMANQSLLNPKPMTKTIGSGPGPEPDSPTSLDGLPETFDLSPEDSDHDSDQGSNNGSDDNVFDIVISSDNIKEITNMTEFVKKMVDDANNAQKHREKERIIYTMFLTILKVENEEPCKNKFIFKNKVFIENLIDKLNEMMLEGKMHWPVEMIVEFEEIKRNRFPETSSSDGRAYGGG